MRIELGTFVFYSDDLLTVQVKCLLGTFYFIFVGAST